MSATTIVTTQLADPLRPNGPWLVMVNNRCVASYYDPGLALRHANNLREQLLIQQEATQTSAWTRRHTRCMLGLLLVMLLLAIIGNCTQARAADGGTVVGLHLATAHFGGHGLKPENPGLYARHASGATGGCYRNSYDRWSCYAGHTWQSPGQDFALTAGAVTGYPARRVMPLLVPSARIPLPTWLAGGASLRVAYIPKPMKHGTASGLHLSTEAEF